MAADAVRAHEQAHVSNNAEEAGEKGLKAHSTVAIHNAVCPECGRIYVSGGTTTTTYAPQSPVEGASDRQDKGLFLDTVA